MTASDIPEIPHGQVDFGLPHAPSAAPADGPADSGLAEALAAAAVELHEAEGREQTARTAVRLARDLVPGTDRAGLFVVERSGRVRTLATTDDVSASELLPPGEELWESPLSVADDGDDGCALFLRLRGHQSRFSVLSLYAKRPGVFADAAVVRVGRLLAAYVGIALETVDVTEQLTEAMHTRDVIGQATGLLMGRLDIDAAQAFDRLVSASQKNNVKLRDIASRIVDASATE
ncbi:transcription antitermination regulator [Streptomyces spiroverticillatus]|uniref:Transcription antitermination regulator n=1 Tax=Streptomyces finlayi TaxID=67296 RepID=A0A919C889_9ACTN|nr:ANTAR domain-containing protein [Streptomyces finlayi]GGZ99998.1 transcription antitermination regulator [Streptomyces spiroverticillatus]GHC84568.1 transcription antitermination regulator [Streptomyces finlayi]